MLQELTPTVGFKRFPGQYYDVETKSVDTGPFDSPSLFHDLQFNTFLMLIQFLFMKWSAANTYPFKIRNIEQYGLFLMGTVWTFEVVVFIHHST